jgi:hypothetical protein
LRKIIEAQGDGHEHNNNPFTKQGLGLIPITQATAMSNQTGKLGLGSPFTDFVASIIYSVNYKLIYSIIYDLSYNL